jgi:haloalkane dehalogenase
MSVVRPSEAPFAALPEYPFSPRYLDVDGMRLHYLDEGRGAPVLLHGEPTWSYLYRRVVPRVVAAGARAVAPDYLGFGRSDKWTEDARYTYAGHVATIERPSAGARSWSTTGAAPSGSVSLCAIPSGWRGWSS